MQITSARARTRLVACCTLTAAALLLVGCRDSKSKPVSSATVAELPPTATPTPMPTPDPARAAALSYAGDFEAAIDVYREVARTAAGDAQQQARFAQAQLLLRTERYAEARAALDAYLAAAGAASDASVARFMQASALEHLGDPAGALAAYEGHAVGGGPLAGYARAEQALILARNGRVDEARIAAEAVATSGVRAGYMGGFSIRIASAFESAGADLDALSWYGRVGRYDGDLATALARSGAIKRKLGDPSWSDDYRLAITEFPGHRLTVGLIDEFDAASVPVSDYVRGVAEYRAGRDTAAHESFNRALGANDEPAGSTYYIAAINERAGRIEMAIDGYAQVPSIVGATGPSPLADNALWWRGRLLEQAGRLEEASADYGQLVDRYPSSEWASDARFHRGMTLYLDGQPTAAALAWAAIGQDGPASDRAKMMFWRGRAQLAARDPGAQATLTALIAHQPADFYALRAEVILGRNDTSSKTTQLDAAPADWTAIGAFMLAQFGIDPRAEAAAGPEDPRWAVGAALENAGLHDESVAVFQSITGDASLPGDLTMLFRIARRLDAEGRTSLAARAATSLLLHLDERTRVPPPPDLLRVAYPFVYRDLVLDASAREQVSPLLLLSLVRQESFYDPQAGSSAGALGLTQVIEPTGRAIAQDLGVTAFAATDLFRPKLSLRFGASYIADQIAAFEGNGYHALAAYNGGPGTASNAIKAAGDDIDLFVESLEFDETKAYVKLVMENYARYRQLYAGLDRPSLPE